MREIWGIERGFKESSGKQRYDYNILIWITRWYGAEM